MERLEEEVKKLKEEIELLKQRLNNYSASYKKYYESNKEIINEKNAFTQLRSCSKGKCKRESKDLVSVSNSRLHN